MASQGSLLPASGLSGFFFLADVYNFTYGFEYIVLWHKKSAVHLDNCSLDLFGASVIKWLALARTCV